MKVTRRVATAFVVGLVPALWMGNASADDTTINVSLWDKGDASMDMLGKMPPMGMNMMAGVDMGMATMGITLDKAEVPAGKVTFHAVNDSKSMIHEMILAPVADAAQALPYDTETMRVDEDKAGHLGEVSELDPGKSGELSLDLPAGTYIVLCNIPGHYALGMWTLLTVK